RLLLLPWHALTEAVLDTASDGGCDANSPDRWHRDQACPIAHPWISRAQSGQETIPACAGSTGSPRTCREQQWPPVAEGSRSVRVSVAGDAGGEGLAEDIGGRPVQGLAARVVA